MAIKRVSDLDPILINRENPRLSAEDLIEVSQYQSGTETYVSKKITYKDLMASVTNDIKDALSAAYQRGMAAKQSIKSPIPLGVIFYMAKRYDQLLDEHPDLSTCFDEFGNNVYPHALSISYVPCDGGTIAPYSRMPNPTSPNYSIKSSLTPLSANYYLEDSYFAKLRDQCMRTELSVDEHVYTTRGGLTMEELRKLYGNGGAAPDVYWGWRYRYWWWGGYWWNRRWWGACHPGYWYRGYYYGGWGWYGAWYRPFCRWHWRWTYRWYNGRKQWYTEKLQLSSTIIVNQSLLYYNANDDIIHLPRLESSYIGNATPESDHTYIDPSLPNIDGWFGGAGTSGAGGAITMNGGGAIAHHNLYDALGWHNYKFDASRLSVGYDENNTGEVIPMTVSLVPYILVKDTNTADVMTELDFSSIDPFRNSEQ